MRFWGEDGAGFGVWQWRRGRVQMVRVEWGEVRRIYSFKGKFYMV